MSPSSPVQVPPEFASVLVGEESLLVRCAERLRARGHAVLAVVSAAAPVRAWAEAEGVRCLAPDADLPAALGGVPVDLLLSVANRRVLPPEVLRLARRAAVNFHDGPLPELAGLNVPVWAILHGATEHGVTWHLMTEGVDRGPILVRQRFPVAPDETAFTLNVKCYEAGAATFEQVMDGLETGTFVPLPQQGTGEVFYRHSRPPLGGVLDWAQPAAALDRLVRALDFGPYPNPVALPRLLLSGGRVLVVRAARLDPLRSGAPGEVLAADGAGVAVAAGAGSLVLTSLTDEEGEPLRPDDLRTLGLTPGARLPLVEGETAATLTERAEAFARHEPFWTEALTGAEPVAVPYARAAGEGGVARSESSAPAPDGLGALAASLGEATPAEALAAALGVYLARLTGQGDLAVGLRTPEVADALAGLPPLFASVVPLRLRFDGEAAALDAARAALDALRQARARGTYALDLPLRTPAIGPFSSTVVLDLAGDGGTAPLVVAVRPDGSAAWRFDPSVYDEAAVAAMRRQLARVVEALASGDAARVDDLDLLGEEERRRLLVVGNDTDRPFEARTIHALIEAQAARTPDREAVRYRGRAWTYTELDARANRIAHRLRTLGVGPGSCVGVGVRRSNELVAALLGVLKAGAAYVPLDPAFPSERLALMAEDAGLAALVTEVALAGRMPAVAVPTLDVDDPALADEPAEAPETGARPEDLAYVLYTSGSTGRPKGVMVEHRQVAAFFAGMDERVEREAPGTWLAVTSVSFDISVLELLWTLARGFTVVVQPEEHGPVAARAPEGAPRPLSFSLFYFASDEGGASAAEKYRLLLDGARFADAHGFEAVWTPERHFHAFGGLYPNPSVASAALAFVTKNLHLRAGSVVSPLHHPARIAEEWAVVDNLSGGRVGISFASGWQPQDFVLRPDAFADRKERFMDGIEEVRALWRGETRTYPGPTGQPVEVRTLPRPIQPELPTWVTAAGNPETFREAGAKGYHLLTHLLGQRVEDLEEKVAIYRAARAANGHDPAAGRVTLMLHTFVGESDAAVRDVVRDAMKRYLASSVELVKAAAWDFPAFRRAAGADGKVSLDALAPEALDEVLEFSFLRYFETGALFGSPATCRRMLERVRAAGVDEVACLVDYGVDADAVLAMLPALVRLRDDANAAAAGEPPTLSEALRAERATHLQCTPTQARLLAADPDGLAALAGLHHLLVGGEALPGPLADRLLGAGVRRLTNLYGPTEATVWASTHEVAAGEGAVVPLGRPLANYRLYVLDERRRPVPAGVPGELWIGGAGVARGYLGRDDLTAGRFVPDLVVPDERMYRTGDLVRRRPDGTLDFLGRLDAQVKLRGFRVELGEIEAALAAHPGVREAAVVVREDAAGDPRLVAYAVPADGALPPREALRAFLEARLPAYMVPAEVVALDALPTTPNRKVDRRALPDPSAVRTAAPPAPRERPAPAPSPSNGAPGDAHALEKALAAIWQDVLGLPEIAPTANFFDLGGHSLLAMQVQARVRDDLGRDLRVVDVFRHPSVRALAAHLGGTAEAAPERVVGEGAGRGAGRRAALLQRRGR